LKGLAPMILTSYFFSLNFLREQRELETDNNPNGFTHQQLENIFQQRSSNYLKSAINTVSPFGKNPEKIAIQQETLPIQRLEVTSLRAIRNVGMLKRYCHETRAKK
jgi:hypothetical protein